MTFNSLYKVKAVFPKKLHHVCLAGPKYTSDINVQNVF